MAVKEKTKRDLVRPDPGGRPTIFSDEIALRICNAIANGEALQDICAKTGMPARRTVYNWLSSNTEFSFAYDKAREMRADLFADEIIKISDTEDPIKARVQIDARRWVASKLNPRQYGERQKNDNDLPMLSISFDFSNPTHVSETQTVKIIEDKTKDEEKK